jgi:acetolactate synthase-1/2/3 large subunit
MAMAHGQTMVSGRPQAVMVHVNLGTANALCGLVNAARENVPMLLCAGRTPITEAGPAGARSRPIHWAQEMFDQGALVREHVKWDYELRVAEQVETAVDRALAIATSEPKGPVYLSLPREVLAMAADTSPRRRRAAQRAPAAGEADAAAIEQAADLLAAARRPLLVTASLGRDLEATAALDGLSARLALPVVMHMPRYACLDMAHPMHLGFAPARLVEAADLILVVDCDVPWIPSLQAPPMDCRVVHIGADPLFERYPMRGFPCDLAIAAPPARVLRQLASALEDRIDDAAVAARRARLTAIRQAQDEARRAALDRARTRSPIDPAWVARCLDEIGGGDTIIVNELALPPEHLPARRPGTYFGPSPAGGLGWGLGAALGAKLAAPGREVIAAVGDGSYMFGNPTPAHFVSRRHRLPVLFVVVNNGCWNSVRRATRAMYPDGFAMRGNQMPLTSLAPAPDYERVVEACGGLGLRVEDPAALPAALVEARRAVTEEGRQALVNVVCGD